MVAIVEQANESSLTHNERKRLDELEKIIRGGLTKFEAVWAAFFEINETRLWREGYTSFNAYVRQNFDIERTRAHQLIAAVHHGEHCIEMNVAPPSNERQARREMEALRQAELERRELRAIRDELKSLPTEEKCRQIMEAEREIIRRAREPKTVGGDGWPETLEAIERGVRKVRKLTERRGPEADDALPHLDSFLAVVRTWD